MAKKWLQGNAAAFCLAYLFSAFGYEFLFFIMTVHVYDLTHNALNVSIFAVISFIPKFFSPLYGALADRFPRQWLLAGAAALTAGLAFGLSRVQEVNGIYVLWFLISVCLTMIANVRGSLFPEVFSRENYPAGNAFMLFMSNGARLLAPLLGGLAALTFQTNGLILAVCLIYLVAAIASTRLRPNLSNRHAPSQRTTETWRAGLEHIRKNPDVRYLFEVSFLWRLFLGLQTSLLIIYVKTCLGSDDAQYGYFMALLSLGSILGSLAGAWLGKRVAGRRFFTLGLGLHYVTFAALGLARQFSLACALVFVSFFIFYATLVSLHTLRDQATPSSVRGRVYGTITAAITLPAIVSMLAGGALCAWVSAGWVLCGAGILAVATLMLVYVFASRAKPAPAPVAGQVRA